VVALICADLGVKPNSIRGDGSASSKTYSGREASKQKGAIEVFRLIWPAFAM
jgi:hypothetical protein